MRSLILKEVNITQLANITDTQNVNSVLPFYPCPHSNNRLSYSNLRDPFLKIAILCLNIQSLLKSFQWLLSRGKVKVLFIAKSAVIYPSALPNYVSSLLFIFLSHLLHSSHMLWSYRFFLSPTVWKGFYCCDTMTWSNLGRKGFISAYSCTALKEVRAWSWWQELVQRPWSY